MKFAGVPRRELGVRTIFNLLGPLTNPAVPRYQLLGVSQVSLLDLMAGALLQLGVERALVVHSTDGLDEISLSGPTTVREIVAGEIRSYETVPEDFGVARAEPDAVKGGDVETNAAILQDVLAGSRGPTRDAAVINAAAALYVSGKAADFREGARLAERALDSGAARATLERLQAVSKGARADADSAA
jgi:anthranilate phosphoribosyltransferase